MKINSSMQATALSLKVNYLILSNSYFKSYEIILLIKNIHIMRNSTTQCKNILFNFSLKFYFYKHDLIEIKNKSFTILCHKIERSLLSVSFVYYLVALNHEMWYIFRKIKKAQIFK